MRVGMRLGPFYASTSLGGRRRPGRSSSSGLIGLCLELAVWALVVSVVVCYFVLKAMWIGGVWLVRTIARSIEARRAEQDRLRRAAEAAAERAHAEVVASLTPEDVDWLTANGWEAPGTTTQKELSGVPAQAPTLNPSDSASTESLRHSS